MLFYNHCFGYAHFSKDCSFTVKDISNYAIKIETSQIMKPLNKIIATATTTKKQIKGGI